MANIKLLIIIIMSLLLIGAIVIVFFNKQQKDISQYCKSDKDCNTNEICQMDIDNQKRCFSKNNMIKRTCTNLVIPSHWLNPKTIPNKNIRNNRHSK